MREWLLDLIFPKRCLGCGQTGRYLCGPCQTRLTLAEPVEYLDSTPILAAYDYDDPIIRQAVWQLKYRGITSLAAELAEVLSERLAEDLADLKHFAGREKILIVPIPLSTKRRKDRGYNQSARLAQALAQKWPSTLEYLEALQKVKETPPQVSLKNRTARLNNLRGAFALAPGVNLDGRTIIIIDDVVTTGATLAEAGKILKLAGAEQVLGAALAHRS